MECHTLSVADGINAIAAGFLDASPRWGDGCRDIIVFKLPDCCELFKYCLFMMNCVYIIAFVTFASIHYAPSAADYIFSKVIANLLDLCFDVEVEWVAYRIS